MGSNAFLGQMSYQPPPLEMMVAYQQASLLQQPEPAPDLSADAVLERRFAGLDFSEEPTQAPIPKMQDIVRGE